MSVLGTLNKRKELTAREVEWKIPDFFSLSRRVDDYDYSPEFCFLGETWYIMAYLNGESRASEGYIDLYLARRNSKLSLRVAYVFSLRRVDGKEDEIFHGEEVFMDGSDWSGKSRAIKISTLLDEREMLVPLDVLTINCSLTPENVHLARSTKNLLKDLIKMSQNGDDSDVTIAVKGEKFLLHKNILRARSPFFNATLKSDTREETASIVSIKDCDADTFRLFVDYVYSGTVENLTEENVLDLLKIADKYQLDELKKICYAFMVNALSFGSFVDVITTSLVHKDGYLIHGLCNYFSDNFEEIMKTTKWQSFSEEDITQVNELLSHALTN